MTEHVQSSQLRSEVRGEQTAAGNEFGFMTIILNPKNDAHIRLT
jgi:hypothetical protein